MTPTTSLCKRQVFDKWEDDSDSLVATCSLPLEDVVALAALDQPGGPDCAAASRTFLLQLQLEPETGEAAAQPRGRAALLQVRVSYSAAGCYAAEPGGQLPGGRDADAPGGQGRGQGAPSSSGDGPGSSAALPGPSTWTASPGPSAAGSPVRDHRHHQQQPEAGPINHAAPVPAASPVQAGRAAAQPPSPFASPKTDGFAAADIASPGGYEAPLPPQAELCVEIVRACGLQAAVKEAQGWLGGGSALLGCAHQVGPHPFATLELPAALGVANKLRTTFQVGVWGFELSPSFWNQHMDALGSMDSLSC
jgi:hypothetical protein